jgi:transcriptional regulator with XRE-family HTH domain
MENPCGLCDTVTMVGETIGAFIRRRRIAANLTQKELADAIEMTDRSVTDWERGKSVPGRDALLRLSEFFRVGLDEFGLGFTEEQDLVEIVQEEMERKRQHAISIMDTLIAADPKKLDEFIRYGEWLTHQSEASPEDQ